MTSSFQVSRVKPTCRFFSSDNECGIGLPRDTSRNFSGAVKYGSSVSRALDSSGGGGSEADAGGARPKAAPPARPSLRKPRRVNSWRSRRKGSALFMFQVLRKLRPTVVLLIEPGTYDPDLII